MTNSQREQIVQLRRNGCSYADIGNRLGISKDTVKSYCRRNNLKTADISTPDTANLCRECGSPIKQEPKKKKRVFCCKACREQWWKKHPEQLHQKAVYSFICVGCGRPFTAYGNAHRRYCSHTCYINHRFKGGMLCD